MGAGTVGVIVLEPRPKNPLIQAVNEASPQQRQELLERLFIRNAVRRETGRRLIDIPTEYAKGLNDIGRSILNSGLPQPRCRGDRGTE